MKFKNKVINLNTKELIYQMPLLLIIFLVPIFVYPHIFILKNVYYYNWISSHTHFDYFSYYSSLLLLIFSLFLLGFLVLRIIKKEIRFERVYVLIILYLIFSFITTLQSKYIAISIFGFNDRNEGILVLIAYMILFVSTYIINRSKSNLQRFISTLYIMAGIVGILGVLQFFGINYFDSSFFNTIISYKGFTKENIDVAGKSISRSVYSTLYNPNYVGSFGALVFPLSFGVYYFSKKKNTLFYGFFSCLIFALLIGSRSRAGIVGTSVAFSIFLFIKRKSIIKNKSKLIIIFLYAIIFISMNYISDGNLFNKFITLSPKVEIEKTINRYARIEDILIDNNEITIYNNENNIIIEHKKNEILFKDNDNGILNTYFEEEKYYFTDSKFDEFSYIYEETDSGEFILLKIKNTEINLFFNESGGFLVGTHDRIYRNITKSIYFGFEGRERFGSSRGYIWSRGIPLLNDNFIIGNGPDTFAVMFPQEDFIGKLNAFGKVNTIVDKPHNFYLQVAHDTGILSLIALLSLFIFYFIKSFLLYYNVDENNYYMNLGVSIMVGISGYLVAAFFNDSVVYVAPIFWALLGTGFAINYKIEHYNNIL